jgi:hypothetical protein
MKPITNLNPVSSHTDTWQYIYSSINETFLTPLMFNLMMICARVAQVTMSCRCLTTNLRYIRLLYNGVTIYECLIYMYNISVKINRASENHHYPVIIWSVNAKIK